MQLQSHIRRGKTLLLLYCLKTFTLAKPSLNRLVAFVAQMLWDSHLKQPALVADIVVRPREHPARRRPHRPAGGCVAAVVVVAAAIAVAIAAAAAEGADEGGVDGHVSEELANLDGQRLLLGEETS